MRNHAKIVMSALFMCIGASLAHADDIRLGEPVYAGSGCPAGSVATILSPDEKSLSVLFDSYVVDAGGANTQIGRKNCNVAIPVHVPQGYSFGIIGVDYRGFMNLPVQALAQLNVNYFLSTGGAGVRTTKTFRGPQAQDYFTSDRLAVESVVWSGCGVDTNLRLNTTMMVQTNARRQEAQATVDSIDLNSGLIYHYAWRTCR